MEVEAYPVSYIELPVLLEQRAAGLFE